MVVLALVLVGVAVWGLTRVPTAFLPNEDQGYLIVAAQLPDGASKERTDAVMQQISAIASKIPGVEHVVTVSGVSVLDNLATLANAGVAFVVLKDWDVRLKEKGQDLRSIAWRLNRALQGVPQAIAFALPPPPIQGIGNVGGFTMQVEIRNGDFDYVLLADPGQRRRQRRQRAIGACRGSPRPSARARPSSSSLSTASRPRRSASRSDSVFSALSTYVGSNYVGPVQQVRTRLPDLHAGAARRIARAPTTSAISRSRRAMEP